MKKFFKILMVLALLSGAALSCTKDYSKEIADVQKQNQDLQALVASLQNALNSTNATVSTLLSTSEKSAADIAKINSDIKAQKGEISALMADVETLEALSEVFAQLGVDLSKKIEDQALLIVALQAQAKELEKEIETVEGKATANAAAIAKIDEILKGIASTLDLLEKGIATNKTAIEANKTAIDANKTAIEANKTAIEAAQKAIKEQIESLSARLTNIVAAPAKDVELQGVKLGDLKRSVINMNFVVAPASAAEAIEAGFGKGVDVKLAFTNGKTRSIDTLNVTVTPDKVTAGEKGAINVYAVIDTIFKDYTAEGEKIFASLVVSGKDEAGAFERISEPVAVITGATKTIEADSFEWYKGDKAVNIEAGIDPANVKHTADSVAVVGNTLTIVAADKDWKTLPCTESDILKDYVLKTTIGGTALSIDEVADLFEIDIEKVKPHFTAVSKKTFTYDTFKRGEWDWAIIPDYADAKKVIAVTVDSTSTKFDVKIELPNENPEEAVGSVVTVSTYPIAFGKLNTPYTVQFTQRIGKHVEEEEAADAQTLEFGVDNDNYNASSAMYWFESLKWLSTTQLETTGRWANIYELVDGKLGNVVPMSNANIVPTPFKPKFVDLGVQINYTEKQQSLRVVLAFDAQMNGAGVVVLEHGDYIDLTVKPYHAAVSATYDAGEIYVPRKINQTTFTTKITVKNLFQDINDWLIKDAKTNADSAVVYDWFRTPNFVNAKYTVAQGNEKTNAGTAVLSFDAPKDSICVTFTKGSKFVEGTPVTISVKDTIDGVIAFDYTIKFTPKKPGVKVVALDGFVQDDVITVEGKMVGTSYEINDINLANYFKVEGLEKKSDDDTKIEVKFADDTTGLVYSNINPADSSAAVSGEGLLIGNPKIKWGTLKATEFTLTAQALLEGSPVGDPVIVTVKTDDPILAIAPVKIDSTLHGEAETFDLLENLEIYSILDDETNIYPGGLTPYGGAVAVNKADMSDWTCTVNGVPYQGADLFTFDATNNKLAYDEHDAVGTVVITIPYKFTYKFGEKKFNVILTIN